LQSDERKEQENKRERTAETVQIEMKTENMQSLRSKAMQELQNE
jgi:hypothetical protein